ncbi:baculoviral IAP repeat-containing protein 3-like [Neocloeon triangulifer]|uniref:baculoviral IAP repeat-containing protein 3-like n=1 Tax=Neocloeon triangulifer TaxID=2078957 RepID=UPI00286EE5BA|nr:baculoviral IAP repeat-containing protein 3-like [Neocloeon triangulifer]
MQTDPPTPMVPAGLGAQQLKLNVATNRQITFPINGFEKKWGLKPRDLAASGLYLGADGQTLYCGFCSYKVALELAAGEPLHSGCVVDNQDNFGFPLDSKLNFEAQRYLTFFDSDWDWKFVSPEQLAIAGFYYLGEKDQCRCAFCGLLVSDWEEGDTPESEHQKYNSKCQFLLAPNEVHNVRTGDEILDNNQDSRVAQVKTGTTTTNNKT